MKHDVALFDTNEAYMTAVTTAGSLFNGGVFCSRGAALVCFERRRKGSAVM